MARTDNDRMRTRARLRMFGLARGHGSLGSLKTVAGVEQRTDMDDARIALCAAMDRWTAWNPEYTDGDDWLKAGREAHYARQAELGRPCDRPSCDLH